MYVQPPRSPRSVIVTVLPNTFILTVNGALQWLEDVQDKSLEELRATAAPSGSDETNPNVEPPALKEGEEPKSMVCTDCGKKFRSMAQVQFHAEKTYVLL